MTVDIIIVNYNTRELVAAALRSVRDSDVSPDRVFVVDNASADGSVEMLRAEFPEVELIESAENLGFARGNNLAFERSDADYVLLLNSDAELRHGALGTMLRAIESDARIGAVGPVLVCPDGSVQVEGGRRDPTILGEFSNITHLNQVYPDGPMGRYMMNDWDHRSTRDVEVLCGACMLVRTAALGGTLFRDDFFMYGEDVELSQRIRAAGYRLVYLGDAEVLHHGGATSRTARTKMRVAGVVSMAQLLASNRGRLYAAGYVAMVPVAWPIGVIVNRMKR
jgi:N-acetylglucosaminyl-diphospho-decaprenol L-rhamnosyltransferase